MRKAILTCTYFTGAVFCVVAAEAIAGRGVVAMIVAIVAMLAAMHFSSKS